MERLCGWGLTVTQIHGGMKIGDRDTPGTRLYAEREFREEAQIMVATEAAGEGVNLQFCWLMINYDIPWNPTRLEQRIGRIHRYGQERDCLIFNFLAANTRERQMLERLLERLREIRRELGSDQVFDVVGEVIPANYLERLFQDLYAGHITQQAMLDRLVEDIDRERFARICRSTLEGLAKRELNLAAILGRTAEARERRLVPEVVEEFFLKAAPVAGLPTPGGRPASTPLDGFPVTSRRWDSDWSLALALWPRSTTASPLTADASATTPPWSGSRRAIRPLKRCGSGSGRRLRNTCAGAPSSTT